MPRAANPQLRLIIRRFFQGPFEVHRGPNARPFYCEPKLIGEFAVAPAALAAGDDSALFKLFVTLSMYQALRDEVIRRRQRQLPRSSVRLVVDAAQIRRAIVADPCDALRSADALARRCDVYKAGAAVDCERHPQAECPVKYATRAFGRMGDMGKLPSSAWLGIWHAGGLATLLREVCSGEMSPTRRATLLVERFTAVHRVGRKLATLFVSALSTPALAPGLTPWFPDIDGNELVVVDTNVAGAVDTLRGPDAARSYGARAAWIRRQASRVDLREFRSDLPAYSPRIVQEALYAFCSRSNRAAAGDRCAALAEGGGAVCATCAPRLCPFALARQRRPVAWRPSG